MWVEYFSFVLLQTEYVSGKSRPVSRENMVTGILFDKISWVITWSSILKLVEKVTAPGNWLANVRKASLIERPPIWDNNLSIEISKCLIFKMLMYSESGKQMKGSTATTTCAATTGREIH